ncbi:SWIM zinc finger family protein [Dehalococcoidia bacterium]|nr:SWIM zinc finger family protein [Dehalococcoidia bacterium]
MGRWDRWSYYEPAQPKPVKDGIKARTQRGEIGETWWSKRWIEVLKSFDMGARLTRGRAYARKGQVVSIDVKKGIVTARVQGTRAKPYSVEITLNPLSDEDWDKVTDTMASQAVFAAKLLSGEMPRNIEEAFAEVEIPLFPVSERELDTDCSCPDWANPCKHIAAVYYLLAENFDDDPFLIFKLRGRTREEIIEILREKRAQTLPGQASTIIEAGPAQEIAAIPLEECLDTFWQAGEALDSFTVDPAPPDVEHAVLKRLGDAPFAIGKHNLAALLTRAYTIASDAALEKSGVRP